MMRDITSGVELSQVADVSVARISLTVHSAYLKTTVWLGALVDLSET